MTMNAKHTRYREVKANDDTGRWEVFQHDVDGSRCWLATFESESWAYEFAAAPDLLEACEAAEQLLAAAQEHDPAWRLDTRVDGVRDMARAALAKAKGE